MLINSLRDPNSDNSGDIVTEDQADIAKIDSNPRDAAHNYLKMIKTI